VAVLRVANVGDSRAVLVFDTPHSGSAALAASTTAAAAAAAAAAVAAAPTPRLRSAARAAAALMAPPRLVLGAEALSRDHTPFLADERARVRAAGAQVLTMAQIEAPGGVRGSAAADAAAAAEDEARAASAADGGGVVVVVGGGGGRGGGGVGSSSKAVSAAAGPGPPGASAAAATAAAAAAAAFDTSIILGEAVDYEGDPPRVWAVGNPCLFPSSTYVSRELTPYSFFFFHSHFSTWRSAGAGCRHGRPLPGLCLHPLSRRRGGGAALRRGRRARVPEPITLPGAGPLRAPRLRWGV
jgi:hypothetical protein